MTLVDCFKARSLELSALMLVNKIAFNPKKGYASATGTTYWSFASKLKVHLRTIKADLRRHTYEFGSCLKRTRLVNGRTRDLYISDWSDRIVERWLNDCLNLLLNKWFSRQSYAYRVTSLGLDSCQQHVAVAITPESYIIKRDITSFFYSIDQDILLGKIAEIIDSDDFLFQLLDQRIHFKYHCDGQPPVNSIIGIPFGSSLACSLANIYLTSLDRELSKLPVNYFRYADDFLIVAQSPQVALEAAAALDDGLAKLKLASKATHMLNASFQPAEGFITVNKFKHLGLEFTATGTRRLPLEKQRKIMNFVKREFDRLSGKLKRLNHDDRLKEAVNLVNGIITSRVRSAAIVDYYLKHVTDEVQLQQLDLCIATLLISTVLGKAFRYRDFKKVPFQKLRKLGLLSLRHRHRLHRHGHLRVSFLSLHNEIVADRHQMMINNRRNRIDHMRLTKKLRKSKDTTGLSTNMDQ